MFRFLLKTLIWTLPGTIACYGIWIGLLYQNPSRDTLGLYRVMPVQCNSMIFGTSRSAQGVNPAVLEQCAPHTGKWFNFSFTLGTSPWNEAYADAVIEKIDCSIQQDKPPTFLLFVDPWMLDENIGKGEGTWFDEPWSFVCDTSPFDYAIYKANPLDVISFGSGSDLLSVFASSIPRQIATAIRRHQPSSSTNGLQPNGWLPNNAFKTEDQISQAIEKKVDQYRTERIGTKWPCTTNTESVTKVIKHISSSFDRADLILIRPPVSNKMYQLEQNRFPKANDFFMMLAQKNGVQFIDPNEQWSEKHDLLFNDGHHMNVTGAVEFSKFLGERLTSR